MLFLSKVRISLKLFFLPKGNKRKGGGAQGRQRKRAAAAAQGFILLLFSCCLAHLVTKIQTSFDAARVRERERANPKEEEVGRNTQLFCPCYIPGNKRKYKALIEKEKEFFFFFSSSIFFFIPRLNCCATQFFVSCFSLLLFSIVTVDGSSFFFFFFFFFSVRRSAAVASSSFSQIGFDKRDGRDRELASRRRDRAR